ncbi:MAG: hypothetical protein R6V55_08905 [Desulfovermiculus sp.]
MTNIQTITTQDIPAFQHTDPEGIAVIIYPMKQSPQGLPKGGFIGMPCINEQLGQKTAQVLQRRAGMPCSILVAVNGYQESSYQLIVIRKKNQITNNQ